MKKVLLDTNAYAALLRGDERVLDVLAKAEHVYFSAVVLGELFAGFRGGSLFFENKQRLDQFMARPQVALLSVGRETADVFGSVKHQLKLDGTPIPLNDVWIASHAMETGAVLVTYDKHFRQVAGLRLWDEV
ncbi:MAG: type II toxin-antitoxin system VapC family toxin [Lentisphaerae bacterium]|nr:type II toxin-antitoxin system VapC family toxin [Lentisphaerota bacterium]